MTKNFWQNLPCPFFALAPMADVTDAVFRQIIAKYSRHGQSGGGPDVLWTEFVSADGLASRGRDALLIDLSYTETERPIVAQLFSSNPANMRAASKLAAELGFDGIDINMGCPDRTIERQGCGAAMIQTPEIAREIIQAAKDGISDADKTIPVSVKTRLGYHHADINGWIRFLLEQNIAALTVHLRTRKELSLVSAHWDVMSQVVALRNEISPETLIIGNGDVLDLLDGEQKVRETGCDGIMIGRAIFGNPFLFDKDRQEKKRTRTTEFWHRILRMFGNKDKYWLRGGKDVSHEEKLNVMVEHAELFERELGSVKNFAVMKKHFKGYANGFSGAKELRMKLMKTNAASEVKKIVAEFLGENTSFGKF